MHPTHVVALALATTLAAQGPLAPTSTTTIDVNPTQGVLYFSSIAVPTGVTVYFVGDYPVQIYCLGDADVRGTLTVSGTTLHGGPGHVSTGAGTNGSTAMAGPGCGFGWFAPATDGQHAGVYGSPLPFDLAGGSPGGSMTTHAPMQFSCPATGTFAGGGGGGTIVIDCEGDLDVRAGGSVLANGGAGFLGSGNGSAGSILLRARGVLTIHTGGLVAAIDFAPGIIRLDAYEQPPQVLGTVQPAPLILRLPFLAEVQPPIHGATWGLGVAAPRGDGVTLAASFDPGPTATPFGLVQIDLATAVTLAFLEMPTIGHDPLRTLVLPMPHVPALVGLDIYTAGLDWLTPRTPRVTNSIHSVLQ